MDIEGCHRLPLRRNNACGIKRVIVKFVNRKHSEDMLRLFLICYRYLWGKCKDLQQRGIFNQVFCLGAVFTKAVSENGPPVKIYHENDLKIYLGDGNASDGE